jgi:threonine dehydratase
MMAMSSDIRRAARVTAMVARCVADTSVTCNETAVIDMRALFERAMSVCLAADAAAQPTASLLDLEASERPSSSVCNVMCNEVMNALRGAAAHVGGSPCTRSRRPTQALLARCALRL